MAQLLLELLSEEIPARMQIVSARSLETRLLEKLTDEGYLPESVRSFVTPRRLTAVVDGLSAAQPDRREERRGPRVGAPDRALQGFLGSVGLGKDQLEIREDKNGAYYFAQVERPGESTQAVLSRVLPELIAEFNWPKSMRWGGSRCRWVRPLRSILCTFDGEPVDFEIGDIRSGNVSEGHRFLAPAAFTVKRFDDYAGKLKDANVMLSHEERQRVILQDAQTLTFAAGLELVDDKALLEENAGLVEWPVVLMGNIDEAFVKPVAEGGLPPEVLTSAMRRHQKYFSVRDAATGNLAPRFVFVSNVAAKDDSGQIVAGNERVLRARLSDARFFWRQDRKRKLADRVEDLNGIIFHARLGSVGDKVGRIEKIARSIAPMVGADEASCMDAARLAKADLTTDVVGEFADLQGVMGRYYAQAQGQPDDVAQAIQEHYAPAGASDSCPSSPVSLSVGIADRLDTLVSFWLIDEKPTGSKDPYALRRAALGVIRMILENGLRIRLVPLFVEAEKLNRAETGAAVQRPFDAEPVNEILLDLLSFFADRLKVYLRERGTRHDLIDAVFALPGQDDLVLIVERVKALGSFLDSEDGSNLLTAYRRASNILKIEEKKDRTDYCGDPDAGKFQQDQERALHEAIAAAVPQVTTLAAKEDFTGAVAAIAGLRGAVDAFFDHVTVNAEDGAIRRNRLLLLSRIRSALETVADFSLIEGSK